MTIFDRLENDSNTRHRFLAYLHAEHARGQLLRSRRCLQPGTSKGRLDANYRPPFFLGVDVAPGSLTRYETKGRSGNRRSAFSVAEALLHPLDRPECVTLSQIFQKLGQDAMAGELTIAAAWIRADRGEGG
jgi:hypothetical protein